MTSVSGDDCYFYYYSTCVKGSQCPFRHEPAALAQEIVCTFWKAGKCTRPRCTYRHLDVSAQKRKTTPCYYESQPGGCRKPHCPFLHEKPKEPFPEGMSGLLDGQSNAQYSPAKSKIIVNKSKIDELGGLILPVQASAEASEARTSAKARLGVAKQDGVFARLGGQRVKTSDEDIEVYEYSESDQEDVTQDLTPEETALRQNAIKTLDLRNRLKPRDELRFERDRRQDEEDIDELDEMEPKKVRSIVTKVKKRDKKEKRLKKKAKKEKKEKKKSKKKEIVADEMERKFLTDNSTGYECEDAASNAASSLSLAARIAQQREHRFAKETNRTGDEDEGTRRNESVARKRTKSPNPKSSELIPSKRATQQQDVSVKPARDSGRGKEDVSFLPISNRKLQVGSKASKPTGSDDKSTNEYNLDDLEKFLKDNPDVDEAASSSVDVMKELDELLKD